MVEIPLTQDMVAIVDEENFDYLNQWKWCVTKGRNTFYATRRVGLLGKQQTMHQILLAAPKGQETDHIDGNGLNNRRSNLRVCSCQQNQFNKGKQVGTYSSIYKGVSWHKQRHYWTAYFTIDNKKKHLGCFGTEAQAALAYNEAATATFGEFARLNIIGGRDGT